MLKDWSPIPNDLLDIVVVRHVRRIVHCGQLTVDLVQQWYHVSVEVLKPSLTCWMSVQEDVCCGTPDETSYYSGRV